jgi:5-methylcytosine-specific restriction enzyme A
MTRRGDHIAPRKEFSEATKRAIRERDWGECQYCGGAGSEVDHIKAAAFGGLPTLENGQLLCGPCHSVKTEQDRANALAADKMAGRAGQYSRRMKAKAQGKHKAIANRNEWPPKGSRKIANRGFGK